MRRQVERETPNRQQKRAAREREKETKKGDVKDDFLPAQVKSV